MKLDLRLTTDKVIKLKKARDSFKEYCIVVLVIGEVIQFTTTKTLIPAVEENQFFDKDCSYCDWKPIEKIR